MQGSSIRFNKIKFDFQNGFVVFGFLLEADGVQEQEVGCPWLAYAVVRQHNPRRQESYPCEKTETHLKGGPPVLTLWR